MSGGQKLESGEKTMQRTDMDEEQAYTDRKRTLERTDIDEEADLIFRRMEPQDVREAAALEATASREPWSEQSYEDALANENACYIVAEQNGAVIGCCGLWQSFEEADICNVVIAAPFRRRGIGMQMLQALMALGAKRGISQFTLEVRSRNTAAVRLYERLGFVTEGVRKGFYQNPKDDALIMWKR